MIELENIVVEFPGARVFRAVNNVSLRIERGEVFGIVGSSGAGKSTLLRTINLLERPTAGKVRIDDRDITDFHGETLRRIRLRIGMIFQHFNLVRNRTVTQNIAMALKIAGRSKREIAGRVAELLTLVGLTDKYDAYPSQLSGGQKQRVGIARALANHPRILLCDEPTSALDTETTQAILDLLKRINLEFKITIVLISHEMDVVKRICDRVAVINRGELVESNDVYKIFSEPEHEITRAMVKHTQNFDLPEALLRQSTGTLVKIVYRGEKAIDPVLSDTSRCYDVKVNILHGQIEYIGGRPFGIFIVALNGKSSAVSRAVEYIADNTAQMEVLHVVA